MEEPLTILYTGGLRGDLALLPRLHTFLRTLRAGLAQPAGRVLLLDQGEACAPDVWHCAATEGRSALIALDALGFDAARVSSLSAAARQRLAANLLRLAAVDADHPWRDGALCVCAGPDDVPEVACGLRVVLEPAPVTQLDGNTLRLAQVTAGEVGLVTLPGGPARIAAEIRALPPRTLPDATITAAVDFILDEARRYTQRR